jgi:acyl-CoA thioesterase FadM
MSEVNWKEPIAGFEFEPDEIIVTQEYQAEKLDACGLDGSVFGGYVDASFYIGLGIHAGIKNGISAEGNVNMLTTLIQHRPVRLGEPLTIKGYIKQVNEVPRGVTIETEVWFEGEGGERAISAPRMALKPDPSKQGERGAGERPAPVISEVESLSLFDKYQLTPERVKEYSTEGNSIHYEMDAANKAGFRAPIIGGGMGVHYLLHTLASQCKPQSFDLSIYFRRPIFWDDKFTVAAETSMENWNAICLLKEEKVLTEARINRIEP